MMAETIPLPNVFDPEQEDDDFLARAKQRASKNFTWKKSASLDQGMRLAYWLYAFKREEEALEACRFLGRYQFAGNYSLWTWVECALALQSRIARLRGMGDEPAECVRRIRAAGFVEGRLEAPPAAEARRYIEAAEARKDKTAERDWSQNALLELCLRIELGGSASWPVAALEEHFQEFLTRLRGLLKVP
jgi:hypothetical protein